MRYKVAKDGQLNLEAYKDFTIQIVIADKCAEFKVDDIHRVSCSSDKNLTVSYWSNKEDRVVSKLIEVKKGARTLGNMIFMECVGSGNKKIQRNI